jgi:putative ABC transport system substrate-binding protein
VCHRFEQGLLFFKRQILEYRRRVLAGKDAEDDDLVIDTARAKKLPTMFAEQGLAAQGALVGYGVSYFEAGRLSAKYVQRILAGASPRDLPVEAFSRIGLTINLNTAREIGVTIPQAVLLRADEVIQ